MSDVSYAQYNILVDQTNAGRGLVEFARHLDYCPLKDQKTRRDTALEHMKTCNCTLAERVAQVYGLT